MIYDKACDDGTYVVSGNINAACVTIGEKATDPVRRQMHARAA